MATLSIPYLLTLICCLVSFCAHLTEDEMERNRRTSETLEDLQLTFVGERYVGKTSLLRSYQSGRFDSSQLNDDQQGYTHADLIEIILHTFYPAFLLSGWFLLSTT